MMADSDAGAVFIVVFLGGLLSATLCGAAMKAEDKTSFVILLLLELNFTAFAIFLYFQR